MSSAEAPLVVSRSQAEKVIGYLLQTGTVVALGVGGYFFSKLDGTVGRLEQTLTEMRVQSAERDAREAALIESLSRRVDRLEATHEKDK